jgi:hypothetical protein
LHGFAMDYSPPFNHSSNSPQKRHCVYKSRRMVLSPHNHTILILLAVVEHHQVA